MRSSDDSREVLALLLLDRLPNARGCDARCVAIARVQVDMRWKLHGRRHQLGRCAERDVARFSFGVPVLFCNRVAPDTNILLIK